MTISVVERDVELNEKNIIRFFQELKKFKNNERWLNKKIEKIKNNQNQFIEHHQKIEEITDKIEESHKEQFQILKEVEESHRKIEESHREIEKSHREIEKSHGEIEKSHRNEKKRLNDIFEKIDLCEDEGKKIKEEIEEFIKDDETVRLLDTLRPSKIEDYKIYLDCGFIKILKNILKI